MICGLPPPQSKIWPRLWIGDCLTNFLKTFFFGEHLRLCPWSLASSIPVLGLEKVCPRKSCPWPQIFLCPWPWPRAFCSRLHFCGRVERACATEVVDSGLIPGRIKLKIIKIGIHKFPVCRSAIKGTVRSLCRVW